jgi:hypothetical protein
MGAGREARKLPAFGGTPTLSGGPGQETDAA